MQIMLKRRRYMFLDSIGKNNNDPFLELLLPDLNQSL